MTFTYQSKTIDWTDLSPWEADYMASSLYQWNVWYPELTAGITLDVECDIQVARVTCASLSETRTLGVSRFRSQPSDLIRLTGLSGFTDQFLLASRFQVGLDGEVQDWQFSGAEYRMVGDFNLSRAGDSWAYAGWSNWAEDAYCLYAQSSSYDWNTGRCANGAPLGDVSKRLDLGVGSWTSNLAELRSVEAVPLPAGLVLVLSGLGLLGALRRRSYRAA